MTSKTGNKTYKMIKLVGESSLGIEDAVTSAIGKSSENIRGQSWAHIVDFRANLGPNGSVDRWQVTVEVGFEVE